MGQACKADVKWKNDFQSPTWGVVPITVKITFGCVRHSIDTAPESFHGASGVTLNPLSLFALAEEFVFF